MSEDELPALPNEVLAEAVVLFLVHEHETVFLVDVPGGIERAVGPEREPFVAASSCEADALLDEPVTQTQTACLGLDQEKPELGNRPVPLDHEDAAHPLPAHLGDPAPLLRRVVAFDEVSDDPRHQSLESLVPA